MKKLWFSLIILFSWSLMGEDLVVIIQAVSKDKKTFIVRKGAIDGVVKGRQSLFSNDQFTLVAYPVETTRDHSLWSIADQRAVVPFEKGDIVTYTNTISNLFLEIPSLRYDAEYKRQVREAWMKAQGLLGKIILRASASLALQEVVTDISPDREIRRVGMHYEGLYVFDFHDAANFAFGLRYDQEISYHESPAFKSTTNRFFALGEFIFHVDLLSQYLTDRPRTIYMGLGGGLGTSRHQISPVQVEGYALLFPTVRLGYQKVVNEDFTFLLEGVLEHIRTVENFSNMRQQESGVLNAKLSFGLKF